MRKWLVRTLIAISLLLILTIALLWTADSDRENMVAKYGGQQALWAKTSAGQDIHYRDEGPKDAPALLLIHGSNASLHTWDDWVNRLKADYRLIRLDLPGHGLSGPHPERDYSAKAMIGAVQAIAQSADIDQFTLIGSSMGGWVSWRFALAHPGQVSKLVLVSGSGPRPANTSKRNIPLGFRLAQIAGLNALMTKLTPRGLIEKSLTQSMVNPVFVTKERVDRYWELLRFPGNRQATLDRFRTDREEEFAQQLTEITAPTLLLWGREDGLVPYEVGEVFDRKIPNSQLIIYDNIGHLPMVEHSTRTVQDLRRFLERSP